MYPQVIHNITGDLFLRRCPQLLIYIRISKFKNYFNRYPGTLKHVSITEYLGKRCGVRYQHHAILISQIWIHLKIIYYRF